MYRNTKYDTNFITESFCPNHYPYPLDNKGQYCCKFGELLFTTSFEDCIEKAKYYNGTDIQTLNDTETPENCQMSCQDNDDCKFWSWENTKICYLKEEQGVLETDQSFISGPKNCPSKKQLLYILC